MINARIARIGQGQGIVMRLGALNASQRRAVEHDYEKALMMVAPPGSGKTHCLISRIMGMLQSNIAPEEVLAVTFTNKAAKEMKDRLGKRLGDENTASKVTALTFHSFCLRICRNEGFIQKRCTIWGDREQRVALKKVLLSHHEKENPGQEPPQNLAGMIKEISAWMRTNTREKGSENLGSSMEGKNIADMKHLVECYGREKRNCGAVDFNDMLELCVSNLRKLSPEKNPLTRWKYVLVDEWQDTSHVQLDLVKLISNHTNAITIVGDPNQSIYGFLGAQLSNWKKVQQILKPEVVCLEVNYRSTSPISKACQGLIGNNSLADIGISKKNTNVETVREGDKSVTIVETKNQEEEFKFVGFKIAELIKGGMNPNDIAILYRSNARQRLTKELETVLVANQVPYKIVAGKEFFTLDLVNRIMAYIKLILNNKDEISWNLIYNYPKRGLGGEFQKAWQSFRNTESSVVALKRFTSAQNMEHHPLGRYKEALEQLAGHMEEWQIMLESNMSLPDFVDNILMRINLEVDETGGDVIATLKTFIEDAANDGNYESLEDEIIGFLEKIALFNPSDAKKKNTNNDVILSTIHQSKGLEWDVVFVVRCMEGDLPSRQALKERNVDEERRLMFVAMSRARDLLFLTHYETEKQKPSRFVQEVREGVQEKLTVRKSSSGFSSASSLLRRKRKDAIVSSIQWSSNPEAETEEGAEDFNSDNVENQKVELKTTKPVASKAKKQRTKPNAFQMMMMNRK